MSDGWDKQTVVDLIGALRTVPGHLLVARNEVGNIALLNPDDGAFVGFVNLRTSEVELTMPESAREIQKPTAEQRAPVSEHPRSVAEMADLDKLGADEGEDAIGYLMKRGFMMVETLRQAEKARDIAQGLLAKMTVYAEQVEHQLAAARKGLQDLAEMVGPRDAGYADVWSSVELLKKERDALSKACDTFESNSKEASEVFEVLYARQLIPMQKPGPRLAELVTKALDELAAYKKAKAENDERFMLERDIAREEANQLLKQLKDFGRDALKVMSLYPPGSDESRALSALVATALSTGEYRAGHPKLCGAEWGGSGRDERVLCTREPEHEGKHSAPLKVLSW